MDPIIRKYSSFEEMKADEYRYWQSRPVHERMGRIVGPEGAEYFPRRDGGCKRQRAACEAFAGSPRPLPTIKPVVNAIGDFIAIVPSQHSLQLEQLAADAVAHFDSLRAPLTPQDRARRNPERLTPRQRDYLDRWGYPYVMEEFRFHMTLTGRLDAARHGPILKMLRERFSTIGLEQLAIDRIALFRQDDARARVRRRCRNIFDKEVRR